MNIDSILHNITDLAIKHDKSLRLGVECNDDLLIKLILLKYANYDCLNNEEISKLKGIINTITYSCIINKNRVTVDKSNKEIWESKNPECINRKTWERIAQKICNTYKIEINAEKISTNCDIAFEITKNITNCDVLTAISMQQKLCDYNISIQANENQCKIDYKLILEKYPECKLTLKEYLCLNENGFSYEIISTLYDNNVYLEVDSNNIIVLNTLYSKYELPRDLKFKEIIIKDGQLELPQRILEDFNITTKQKKQIIDEFHIL